MKATKLILFTLLGISFGLLACKKTAEPPVGTCSDGYMNNGELGIDCGGPCPPCDSYAAPVFFAAFNAELVMFGNPTAFYGDTIYLAASNDSIQVSLRFKNLTEADQSGQFWPYLQDGQAFVTYNGVNYTEIDTVYSTVIITENTSNRLSGLFQLYLPYGVANADTLKVVNGTFNNIPY